MERISAASDVTIEMQMDRWRLMKNGYQDDQHVLLEVVAGQPVHYLPSFASSHRLPSSGKLDTAYIQRVVLGWSNEDESWHLGLVLEPELASARGSRWCEMAHWPDPDTTLFSDIASQAGEALAQIITRPFNLIPPRIEEKVAPPPMPPLPQQLGQWTVAHGDVFEVFGVKKSHSDKVRPAGGYREEAPAPLLIQLKRDESWVRARLLRALWYLFWAVVFVILSVSSFRSGIALPRPEIIPYMGLAAAAILLGMVIHLARQLTRLADTILVNEESRNIWAKRSGNERWRMSNNAIQAVYVSEIVSQKKGGKPVVQYGELNLLVQDDSFFHLLEQEHPSERSLNGGSDYSKSTDFSRVSVALPSDDASELQVNGDHDETFNSLLPLSPRSVSSPLQVAGLYVATALGVPCYYDLRTK